LTTVPSVCTHDKICIHTQVLDAVVVSLAIDMVAFPLDARVRRFKFRDFRGSVRFENTAVDIEWLAIALEDHVARTVALVAAKGDVDSRPIFDTAKSPFETISSNDFVVITPTF
jgi:hypothetical protein